MSRQARSVDLLTLASLCGSGLCHQEVKAIVPLVGCLSAYFFGKQTTQY